MNDVKLIDVTLRDGGYQNNFNFCHDEITKILMFLDKSNIEYIEVGYRNGSLRPIKGIGETGLCPAAYLQHCRSMIKNSKLTVMLHPHNVNQNDLDELRFYQVDTLRVCLTQGKENETFAIIEKAKNKGFEVSINITRMSHYSSEVLDKLILETIQRPVDMIYFADSNGSMQPQKIKSMYQKYNEMTTIPFGFHAHDNLGLAQANALAALDAGAKYIDTALAGFGKGIGNLKTDFFVAYLHSLKIKKYDMDSLLQASNYIRDRFNPAKNIKAHEFQMGIEDLSIDDILNIDKQLSLI